MSKTYSREEADEILRRALAQQDSDGIQHDDLVAAAREVGIPESAVDAAASQLGEHRVVQERVEKLRRGKRRSFGKHLLSYLIANGGIFLFDYFDGGPWFFHYVLIVWGIILLLFGIRQLAPEEASLVRKAERELEKERRRQERQRRVAARASGQPVLPGAAKEAAKEFERAVQEGVHALLGAATRTIRDFTPGPNAPRPKYRADEANEDESVDPDARNNAARRRTGRA